MHGPGHEAYRISRATVEDAPAIAQVHVDGWRASYRGLLPDAFLDTLSYAQRDDLWRSVLKTPADRHIFVAREEAGPLVGFASGGRPPVRPREYEGELHALYVQTSHQRRGVGSGLWHAVAAALLEEGVDSMFAWIFAENPAARFFESVGGHRFDERTVEIAGRRIEEVAFGWNDLGAAFHRPYP
jgi:L-amino acid N-acyltransferase YncA